MRLPLGDVSLRRIAITSLLGFVIAATTAFFLSPYIVRSLGVARYGTWVLIAEIGGYYGLLDFGFRPAIAYLVATKLSRNERAELPGILSSAFWTLAILGLVVLMVGAGVTIMLPTLFRLDGVSPFEAQLTMAIITVMLALHLPLELFSAVVNGCRRLDLVRGVDILLRLATSVGFWAALSAGGGMVQLVAIQFAGRVLGWSASFVFARQLLGSVSLSIAKVTRSGLRAVWDFGSKSFVMNLALMVIGRIDTIVIGVTLNVSLITVYSIGRILVDYVSQVVAALSGSFTMHLTDLRGRGDESGLRTLFSRGSRLAALLALPMAACLGLFGASFIQLWQGPQFVSGPWTQRSDVVLYIWIVAQLPRWIQWMSWQLLIATYRVKFLMWVEMGEAVANLALSLVLVRRYGIVGVAFGTLIPAVIVHGVILPKYVSEFLDVPLRRLVSDAYARPTLVALLVAAVGFATIQLFGLATWREFAGATAITAAFGALVALRIGLTTAERGEVVDRALRLVGLRSGA
jgi:O-antigen/teichoic acid export membrane protein